MAMLVYQRVIDLEKALGFLNVGGFGRLGMSFFFCVLFSHVSPAEDLKSPLSWKTSDHKQLWKRQSWHTLTFSCSL